MQMVARGMQVVIRGKRGELVMGVHSNCGSCIRGKKMVVGGWVCVQGERYSIGAISLIVRIEKVEVVADCYRYPWVDGAVGVSNRGCPCAFKGVLLYAR